MLAANLLSHQETKIFYRLYLQEDYVYYYANGIAKFTFVDSMVCDYFYYYYDGIVKFTFANSVRCDYFYYYNNGIVEFTFCGLGGLRLL